MPAPAGLLLDELASGVRGYTRDVDGALWIPIIIADDPGSGAVGRYLDSLPRDREVRVPNVFSSRLAGMLMRRGFHTTLGREGTIDLVRAALGAPEAPASAEDSEKQDG